jgi:RNA polymerase sigma factor (sigma-70 family)
MMLTEPAPPLMSPATPDADDLRLYATTRDRDAFARVVRRHIDLVYTFCRRELRDAHLAEDAAQAVFILLAAKASSFRSDIRLTGWLYETSRNCCRNARRSQIRRTRHESAAAMERPEMNISSPTSNLESQELADQIHGAIARLSREQRDLVLMRYFRRLSSRQVSELLAISEEAAKQRIARAVRQLRTFMRESTNIDDWLERSALLAAPLHLAESATHAALTGAAGAPATIAKAVATAKSVTTALILAATVISAGAILAAAHFAAPPAAQSPIITTPQPALTPSAPAPAAAPDEAKERSSPLNCLRAISAREKAFDTAGLEACMYDDGSDMAQILKHSICVDIAQIRLSSAAKSTFGPDADVFHEISSPTTATVIDLMLAAAPPEIQINGDTATMPLRLPPILLQMGMQDYQGLTLRFVRSPSDGGWKINLASSLMYISFIPGKGSHPAATAPTIAFLDAVADVADRVSGEISRHEIASPELIGARFNLLMNQERASRKIEITGGQTVPRPDAAKTH